MAGPLALALPLLFSSPPTAASGDRDWQALAAFWAPVIVSGTSRQTPEAVVTTFDFDGDMAAGNNLGSSRAMSNRVDFWALGSTSHVFLGYAFYHNVVVEENSAHYKHSMHGIVIALDVSEGVEMGRYVAALAWGGRDHPLLVESDDISPEYSGFETWSQHVIKVAEPRDDFGDVDFVVDNFGVHPVVYLSALDHGVWPSLTLAGISRGPAIFDNERVVDWSWIKPANEPGELKRRMHRPGNNRISGGEDKGVPLDDGLIFRYEGLAMSIVGNNKKGRGTMLHHWNLIAYDLQPINALWKRRHAYDLGDTSTFQAYGVFAGQDDESNGSVAPWYYGEVFFAPFELFGQTLGDVSDHEITASSFDAPSVLIEEFKRRAK